MQMQSIKFLCVRATLCAPANHNNAVPPLIQLVILTISNMCMRCDNHFLSCNQTNVTTNSYSNTLQVSIIQDPWQKLILYILGTDIAKHCRSNVILCVCPFGKHFASNTSESFHVLCMLAIRILTLNVCPVTGKH